MSVKYINFALNVNGCWNSSELLCFAAPCWKLNDIALWVHTSELRTSPAIRDHTTQCYLPPDTGERTPPDPSQKRYYLINLPRGMEGWVYLGGWSAIPLLTGPNVEQLHWSRTSATFSKLLRKILGIFLSYLRTIFDKIWETQTRHNFTVLTNSRTI